MKRRPTAVPSSFILPPSSFHLTLAGLTGKISAYVLPSPRRVARLKKTALFVTALAALSLCAWAQAPAGVFERELDASGAKRGRSQRLRSDCAAGASLLN